MSRWYWIAMATLVVFAALAVVAPGTALADGKEEDVAVKDLPKVIVATVNALFPEGTIVEAEKETETEDGKTVVEYEVKVKTKEGKVVEVEFEMTADGKIKKIEIDDKEEKVPVKSEEDNDRD